MNQAVLDLVRQVLEREDAIKLGWVFGSAVAARFTEQSDVDIAVAADAPLRLEAKLDLAHALTLAVGREVDLIDLQSSNGTLLQEVLTSGKFVLKRDTDLYATLLKRMWYDQADMQPLYRRMLAKRRERFLRE